MAIIPERRCPPTPEELRQREERNSNASFYKIFADGHELSHAIVNYMICLAKDICPNPAPCTINSNALVGLLRQQMVVFFPPDKSLANLKEDFACLTAEGHAWRNRMIKLFFEPYSHELHLHIGELLKNNYRTGKLSLEDGRHFFAEINYFIQHARYAWHDASLDTLYTIRLLLIEANSRINNLVQRNDAADLAKLLTASLNNFQPFLDRLLLSLPGASKIIAEIRANYSRGKVLDAIGVIDERLASGSPGRSVSANTPEPKESDPSPNPSGIDGANPEAGAKEEPLPSCEESGKGKGQKQANAQTPVTVPQKVRRPGPGKPPDCTDEEKAMSFDNQATPSTSEFDSVTMITISELVAEASKQLGYSVTDSWVYNALKKADISAIHEPKQRNKPKGYPRIESLGAITQKAKTQ